MLRLLHDRRGMRIRHDTTRLHSWVAYNDWTGCKIMTDGTRRDSEALLGIVVARRYPNSGPFLDSSKSGLK